MKDIFSIPEIELIKFANEDIVTTSGKPGGSGEFEGEEDEFFLLDLI